MVGRGGGVGALVVVQVTGEVDDAVGTEAEHLNELQAAIGDAVAEEVLVLLVGAC